MTWVITGSIGDGGSGVTSARRSLNSVEVMDVVSLGESGKGMNNARLSSRNSARVSVVLS